MVEVKDTLTQVFKVYYEEKDRKDKERRDHQCDWDCGRYRSYCPRMGHDDDYYDEDREPILKPHLDEAVPKIVARSGHPTSRLKIKLK